VDPVAPERLDSIGRSRTQPVHELVMVFAIAGVFGFGFGVALAWLWETQITLILNHLLALGVGFGWLWTKSKSLILNHILALALALGAVDSKGLVGFGRPCGFSQPICF